jgi:ADP-heptose:LPS heptosyltransferase
MSQQLRILVIKPSSLGDIIHGLQVAATIKHHLPAASIDWVVGDRFADIVIASGIAENVFIFHRGGGLRKFITLIGEIRKFRYNYVIDMQGLARSGVMAYFSRGDKKIGRSDAREFAWLAYDEKVPLPPPTSPHAIDILLQFLPKLGLPVELRSELSFSPDPSVVAGKLLGETHCRGKAIIRLFPESRRKEKEWPYFRDLAVVLGGKLPKFLTVVVGQRCSKTYQSLPNVRDLSGETSMVDAACLISTASFVIANDSAPMHLAAALNTPLLALFGPTDPRKFGPYHVVSEKNIVLEAWNKDLSSISVDEVFSAIVTMVS